MEIKGKNVKFKASIRAVMTITDLCPDGDVNRVNELFGKMDKNTIESSVKFIVALSDGSLTEDDVLDLDINELQGVLDEAMKTFRKDQEPTVNINPKKDEAAEPQA